MAPINIALLGLGNVGQAFARYLLGAEQTTRQVIRAVIDSSGGLIVSDAAQVDRLLRHKSAGQSLAEFSRASVSPVTEVIDKLAAAGVSVLVESLPTNIDNGLPALDLILEALRRGINVVTVDKGPPVHGFDQLQQAAREGHARFGFTGTTGVAIPDELEGERVIEIRGVLNGTTNFILSAMQQDNLTFAEALSLAQSQGIAEPDPTLDVEGWDSACKILILARSLMGARAALADVSRIGIGAEIESLIQTARETDRVVKLMSRARFWQGRVRVSVAPKLVGRESPFYSVAGTSKAAVFTTESGRDVVKHGHSGRDAISEIILSDVLKVCRV